MGNTAARARFGVDGAAPAPGTRTVEAAAARAAEATALVRTTSARERARQVQAERVAVVEGRRHAALDADLASIRQDIAAFDSPVAPPPTAMPPMTMTTTTKTPTTVDQAFEMLCATLCHELPAGDIQLEGHDRQHHAAATHLATVGAVCSELSGATASEPVPLAGQPFGCSISRLSRKPQVLAAVAQDGWALQHASRALRADRQVVIVAVRQCGASLEHASPELRGLRAVVLTAVAQDGNALRHAAANLQADAEVVLTAAEQHSEALFHAAGSVWSDCQFVIEAIARLGVWVLEYAPAAVANDRAVMIAAVAADGNRLAIAPPDFCSDRELVIAAVGHTPHALEFASPALRADRQVVMLAVRKAGGALQHAGEGLRGDYDVVLAAVSQNGRALSHVHRLSEAVDLSSRWISPLDLDDGVLWRHVVLTAVQQEGYALQAAGELKADRQVVLAAVSNNYRALGSATLALRSDRQVVLKAFEQSSAALRHAGTRLLQDRSFLLECICLRGDANEVFWRDTTYIPGDPWDPWEKSVDRVFAQELVEEARVIRGGGALIASLQRLAFAGSLQPGFAQGDRGDFRRRAQHQDLILHACIGGGCYHGDGTVELHRFLPPRVSSPGRQSHSDTIPYISLVIFSRIQVYRAASE
jgi:hypothetical protein